MPPTSRLIAIAFVPTTILVLAVAAWAAGRGDAANGQAPPVNTSVPSISGQPVAGEFLNATPGTWTGADPIAHAYQWQLCNPDGASCRDIVGSTAQRYIVCDERTVVGALVYATPTPFPAVPCRRTRHRFPRVGDVDDESAAVLPGQWPAAAAHGFRSCTQARRRPSRGNLFSPPRRVSSSARPMTLRRVLGGGHRALHHTDERRVMPASRSPAGCTTSGSDSCCR